MSKIAIIGTGHMGKNLGKGWAKAGHTIVYGSRDPGSKSEMGAWASVTTQEQALDGPDVVVITLPYTRVEPFAREHAAALRGKLVIDISNPFASLPDNRISGAEVTANAIGQGARVIAAFKDNFAATILEPRDSKGDPLDVHFAGGDLVDKKIVTGLIEDLGFRAVDCGDLKSARILDGMVSLMIDLDGRYNNGAHRGAWKFVV